jgi:hypothetical protein
MKTVCLVLVMTSFGFTQRTAYAYASHLTPQQSPASSTAAGSDHPRDAEHTGQANDDKHQKVGTPSNEQGNDRLISDKSHSRNRTSLFKANRPQQLRNIQERSTLKTVMNVHQPSFSKPAAGAAKITNNRTWPVRATGVAALNGQQFKNSRNRGTTSAIIIGGPARTPRNTAAISGTRINRKHVN